MHINQEWELSPDIVSAKLRWLAILAGCFSAVFGVTAFGAPFLILGAAIQPRARTTGRWLMWLGALLLSLIVVPFGTGAVFEGAKRLGRDNWSFTIFPLFVVSTALVYWCDIALVVEALRLKRNKWARGSLDWLVWIAAIVLSTWCVWQDLDTARAYQRLNGLRIDLILTTVGLDTLIFCFDVALIIHAIKSRLRA
ncbi:MAG: hypothetical protein JOZ32_06115 [Bryobacterales bacterium]|nr:hypothetical protein [Bryobacterales bacterium]